MGTKIPINIAGNLVADPELSVGESGVAHAKLRVAVNQRIQGADGTWQDGEPVFHNVSAFRALAENSASSLRKGDPVTVAGELEFRSYEKDGERREARRIVADTIGPDLRFDDGVGPSGEIGRGLRSAVDPVGLQHRVSHGFGFHLSQSAMICAAAIQPADRIVGTMK